MEELTTIFGEERGKELIKICEDEKITDMNMLRSMPSENLKMMGFKFGEIAKLLSGQQGESVKVKGLLEKIRDIHQSPGKKYETKQTSEKRKAKVHRESKLTIGWLHASHGCAYRQKKLIEGGGTREISVSLDEASFDSLKYKICEVFIKGEEHNFDIKLGNFKRDEIDTFTNLSNQNCSLKEYMKCHGLFASKFRMYLMTKPIHEGSTEHALHTSTVCLSSTEKQPAHASLSQSQHMECKNVNQLLKLKLEHIGYERALEITYVRYGTSSHDQEISFRQVCFSKEECYNLGAKIDNDETNVDDYNPFADNFSLRSLVIEGTIYLEEESTDENITYVKPQSIKNKDLLIAHQPHEICGYANNEVVIGVIANDNISVLYYEWYCGNDIIIYSWAGYLLYLGKNTRKILLLRSKG